LLPSKIVVEMLAKLGFALVLVVLLVGEGLADTPANCTYDDIVGTWIFYESDRGHSSSVDCTNPKNLTHQSQLEILFPNIVIDQYGNKGFWTIIYNQGFEVTINSRRYFAFSNWTEVEHHRVMSRCHETKPGWSHDIYVRDWSCYIGKKQGTEVVKVHKDYSRVSDKLMFEHMGRQMYRNNFVKINKINEVQSSWVAQAYPEHERYTHLDILRRMGGPKSRITHRPKPAPITSRAKFLSEQLPESFDWRNVSGVNYISPVRNQGSCGSCYAFASMALLESRYRIMTNNLERLVFSPQDVVQCSEYSQGCDGGFPYLIAGKYGEDFGVVPETCNPYKDSQPKQQTCETSINCRRYYATNYHYVGGYYGATNEPLMRLALVNNGPVAVGFEVYDDFMEYRTGVYHHTGVTDNLNRLNKWDPFQLTNHAVLVVGYGTDPDTKTPYWTVKNSWGTGWGEQGYFRIRRGTDECGIESLAVEATPIPTY
jgi:cathepsin C